MTFQLSKIPMFEVCIKFIGVTVYFPVQLYTHVPYLIIIFTIEHAYLHFSIIVVTKLLDIVTSSCSILSGDVPCG
jgi:hypothetical protein